jgi:hypothetical protein
LWHDKKAGDPIITDDDAKNFEKIGYTKDQIKHMKEQLQNAGYNQQN